MVVVGMGVGGGGGALAGLKLTPPQARMYPAAEHMLPPQWAVDVLTEEGVLEKGAYVQGDDKAGSG